MSNLTLHKPWEQYPEETDKAYQRFSTYLQLGPKRSIKKVRQTTGKPQSYDRHLYTWSSKYNWVERASAYDKHLIRKSLQNKEEIIDHAKARLLSKLDEALDELFELMEMPSYYTNDSTGSNVGHKIKIIHDLLDRVGVVGPKEEVDPSSPKTVQNFVQNIYNRIEEKGL